MKCLYKVETTYSDDILYEAYKLSTKKIRILYILLGLFLIISTWILVAIQPENGLWGFLCILWTIFLVFWIYLSVCGHINWANKLVKPQKAIYNVDELSAEFSFYEDKVTQFNPISKWSVDFFYDSFSKIIEVKNSFMIYLKKDKIKFLILIDKNWFTQWNPKTFREFITSKIKSNKKSKRKEKSKKTR